MHIIRFPHHYSKLHGQDRATLIAVKCVTVDERFPVQGLCYDTKYEICKGDINTGFTHGYEFARLKEGEYLQLVFMGNQQIPFTTYRKIPKWYEPLRKTRTYRKTVPYSDLIGETFVIKYKGKKLPRKLATALKKKSETPVKIFD